MAENTSTPEQFTDPETGLVGAKHDGQVWFKSGGGYFSADSVRQGLEHDPNASLATPEEVSHRLAVRAQDTAGGAAKIAAKEVAAHTFDVATGLIRYPAMGLATLTGDDRALNELQQLGGQQVLENTYGLYRELVHGQNQEAAGREYHEATSAQAEANPGTTTTAGIVGDVAPILATGGLAAAGRLAGQLPSEIIAEHTIGKLGSGLAARVGTKALAGAIQGVSFGEQAASEAAYLQNEPLTRQKLWASGAMGGLFGGGLSAGVTLAGAGAGAARAKLADVLGRVAKPVPKGSLAAAIGDSTVSKEAAQEVADRVMAGEGVPAAPGLGDKLHSLLTDLQAATTDGEKSAIKDYGLGAILDPKTRVKALSGIQMFKDRPQIIEKASSEIAESMTQLEQHAGGNVFESVRDLGMKRNAWEKLVDPAKRGEQVDAARALMAETQAKLEAMLPQKAEKAVPEARSVADLKFPSVATDDALALPGAEATTAHAQQMRNLAEQFPPTPEELDALKKWTWGYDSDIRAVQRGASDAEIDLANKSTARGQYKDAQHIADARAAEKHLQKYLDRVPPAETPVIYRGVALPESEALKLLRNDTISLGDAAASASVDPEIAYSFATPRAEFGNVGVVLKLEQRSARGIQEFSEVPSQRELLIPKGVKFKVTGRFRDESNPNIFHIQAREIEPGEAVGSIAAEDTAERLTYGDAARIKSALGHARRAAKALEGDADGATAAIELDAFKRNLGKLTKGSIKRYQDLQSKGDFAADAVGETARVFKDTYEKLRQGLMNEELWGKAGTAQKEINQGWQNWLDSRQMYRGALTRRTGSEGSGEFGMWDTRARYEIDPEKVGGWIDKFGTGRGKLADQYIRAHIDATEGLTTTIGKYVDSGDLAKSVQAVRDASKRIQSNLKVASETVAVANQVQLAGSAHMTAAAKLGLTAAGAMAGGPIGGAAGAALGFLMSPGKVMNAAMAIQGLLSKVDGEKASALKSFFGSATRKVGDAAKKAETVGEFTTHTEAMNATGVSTPDSKTTRRLMSAAAGQGVRFFSSQGGQARADQYQKRREQLAVLTSNPEMANHQIQTTLGALPGIAPQLASSLAMDAMRNLSLLQQMAPPASPVGGMFGGKRKTFTPDAEIRKFAAQWDGVMNPLSVLHDLKSGSLNMDKVTAARTAHPELFAEIAGEFLQHMTELESPMDPQAALQADLLLGLNGAGEPSVEPGFLARIASLSQYQEAQQESQPTPRPPVNMAKGTATLSQSLAGA